MEDEFYGECEWCGDFADLSEYSQGEGKVDYLCPDCIKTAMIEE